MPFSTRDNSPSRLPPHPPHHRPPPIAQQPESNLSDFSDSDSSNQAESLTETLQNDFRIEFEALYPLELHQDDLLLRPDQSISNCSFDDLSFPLAACQNGNCFPFVHLATTGALMLQASYFIDGGCAKRKGSAAFVSYYHDGISNRCDVDVRKMPSLKTTNNQAEFTALLMALKHAVSKKLKRILIVADSSLTANFIAGRNRIRQECLYGLSLQIEALIPNFEAIYVSHIHSHQAVTPENDLADALCSWALSTDCSATHSANLQRVPHSNERLELLPLILQHAAKDSCKNSRSNQGCTLCSQSNHVQRECPITQFSKLKSNQRSKCLICLSPHHTDNSCPLMASASRKPILSAFTPAPAPTAASGRSTASLLFQSSVDDLKYPNNCSRRQFLSYWDTIFLALLYAETEEEVNIAIKAARAWSRAYHFQGDTIKRSKPRAFTKDPGSNLYQLPTDPLHDLAKRALKAARLLPKARISDVSKALRTSAPVPLSSKIIQQLQECYPMAAASENINFPPKPLENVKVNRDAVARIIMQRSPRSHPGDTGITFDILQHFCRWTYKIENEQTPDHRWDNLCALIAKIMSGRAGPLSNLLLDVVGAFFNKNAEKNDGSFALRNLGIEESLLRVAAALVFEKVLPPAIHKNFLTQFDLGAGVKSGAEIFGRVAAMMARSGAPVAVFDIKKAFNNLRRKDVFDAVEDFGNPLLTAFAHFLFSRASKVTFTCPLTGEVFCCFLTKGIHQGNPLSVFIFCLTIAYILKPLRAKYPQAVIAAFVDDIFLALNKTQISQFPELLQDFMTLFKEHGLQFDLSSSAKSSVYSVHPLPDHIKNAIQGLGVRCQNDGITPCKVPTGSRGFMEAFISKATVKLQHRYDAFKALWPALQKYDRSLKKPSHLTFEPYLNLVRLSFLSMPTYVLRTSTPSFCVAYARMASEWSQSLIDNVLPPFISLPPSEQELPYDFPNLPPISRRIMQLPLSLGGLSLRLADSIKDIAYASSCIDCLPTMRAAAKRSGIRCEQFLVPELQLTQHRIRKALPSLTPIVWSRFEDPDDDLRTGPLQQQLTVMFNSAEIKAIGNELHPWPIYGHAFDARFHKDQEHVSWPLNPRSRAHFSLAPLVDAEFSRTIALSIFYPLLAPRACSCGDVIDPAGLHFLYCAHNHYSGIHDRVKHAIAARLRSFVTAEMAPLSVLVEQPMAAHFGTRPTTREGDPSLVADLILLLHSDLQQTPIACDFVSCLPRQPRTRGDFTYALIAKAQEKRWKYAKHGLNSDAFFPLPFSRTNALSSEVFNFCALVDRHFPSHFHVHRKLRATFARAIYCGVAQHMNLAVRRMQLSVAAVLSPFVSLSRFRLVPRAPAKFSSSHALLIPCLSSILAENLADASRVSTLSSEGWVEEVD
jgi:ribonuclease HI